ncbi:MAG: substrate-binding domain-containing protein [Acidobacteria bacterium]|nr:substrate-binding domain-containing protein [Acidobacteriota bacterium]
MRTPAVIAAALLSLATVQPATLQGPADLSLRVLCSNAIRVAMERLLPDAERTVGRPVSVRFSSSTALRESIDRGEAFDLAILTPEMIETLVRNGTIRPATRRDLASVDLAVGVRAGSPKTDISTPDAVRRRLLAARSMTWTEGGASSGPVLAMIRALDLEEQLRPRIVLQRVPGTAAGAVARGDHELFFAPVSEIQAVPGVEVLGLLPPPFQQPVVMTAGIAARTRAPGAAAALVGFLTSPTAARALEAAGMKPAR